MDYARACKGQLKQIFLVHGEERGSLPLMQKIQEEAIAPVMYPEPGQVVEI
jgi:hypothetical protein